MPRYIWTQIPVSHAIRGQGAVGDRLLEHRPSELCVSSITLADLQFGAEAKRSRKLRRAIAGFIKDIQVVSFDKAAADRFALVAAALARRGKPIGAFDTLMAAHALSLGLTVVTNGYQAAQPGPGPERGELGLNGARSRSTSHPRRLWAALADSGGSLEEPRLMEAG